VSQSRDAFKSPQGCSRTHPVGKDEGVREEGFTNWGVCGYTVGRKRRCLRVLSIRLARIGKKKKPFYRVVVIEKSRPRNGRTLEVVGTYDPLQKPALVKLDADRVKYWLGCGAQPSDTVRSFFKGQKIA
jgi:small subunit ribosomal protein S16